MPDLAKMLRLAGDNNASLSCSLSLCLSHLDRLLFRLTTDQIPSRKHVLACFIPRACCVPCASQETLCKMQAVRCQDIFVCKRSFSLSPCLPCTDCFKNVLPHSRRLQHAGRAQTRRCCIQAQSTEGTGTSTDNNRRSCLLGVAAAGLLSASDAR